MTKTFKRLLFILILLVLLALLFFTFIYFLKPRDNSKPLAIQENSKVVIQDKDEFMNDLLEGFPKDLVPLFRAKNISSVKYFVNYDPQNADNFFGKRRNYYNVVFTSVAGQAELLNYYKQLFTEYSELDSSDSMVVGKIGKYRVTAAHYGSSDNTVYLQVYLPDEEFSSENKYYSDYPNNIEFPAEWPQYESSYGKLSQKGGQVEYTRYFALSEDIKKYKDEFIEKYKSEQNFKASDKGMLTWTNSGYDITLTFSEDHGRVYLMMRRPK